MDTIVVDVDTTRDRVVDLTQQVRAFCAGRGGGFCNVFAPHHGSLTWWPGCPATRPFAPSVLVDALELLLPRDDRYRHVHGSPGHGADHVVPALVAPTLVVPVQGGEPLLGTWQSVVLVDLNRDNPRRHVRLSFLAR